MAELQRSGSSGTGYKFRFLRAAGGLERALGLLGCDVTGDGTGMVYVVVNRKTRTRIGGECSCAEEAMCSAVSELMRKEKST